MKSKEKKKIIVAVVLLCLLCLMKEMKGGIIENNNIRRNEPGEGTRQETLEAKTDGKSYEIEVEIAEREFTKKEAKKQIADAKKEIDHDFLGKNKSLNKINQPVVMQSTYGDGLVNAQWSLSREDIFDRDGKFVTTEIPKEGELMSAKVLLSCGEVKEVYQFSFQVYPPILTMEEKIQNLLQKENRDSVAKREFALPKEIDGKNIQWKEKSSHSIFYLLLLVGISVVLLKRKEIEEERKQKKKREEALLLAYPQLVNTLSLLLGAGMSVQKAWEKMALSYKAQKGLKSNIAYEELCYTWNEMKDGIGERKAYENFGKRCGLQQYKKLASLLEQNSRKGTAGIAQMLEKEAEIAMVQRRNLAKKLGEEAGTKMLLPMMMMLGIVMVIVLVPAVLSL